MPGHVSQSPFRALGNQSKGLGWLFATSCFALARNLVAIDCSRYKTVIQFSLPNFRFGSRPAKTHRATIGQHAPFIWMHTLTSERMWYPQSGHMNVVQPSASATLTNLITSQLSSLTFNCRSYGRGCVLVDNRVP